MKIYAIEEPEEVEAGSGGAVDKEKKNDIFKTKYLARGDKNEQRKS